MDDRFRRSVKVSAIAHAVALCAILLIPLVVNWRVRKEKKRETITFIDFTVAIPSVPQVQEVKQIRAPEPPKPPPPPVKTDIPEPPKKTAIKKSEKKIKRPATPPPKPQAPPLSQEEIRKLLAAGAKVSDRTSIPPDIVPAAWYYALVRQTMYDAWSQPGSLSSSAGLATEVEIRVERDGTISRRKMTRPSGNPLMDGSVMRAVESVAKLKPVPADFPDSSRTIVIEFELTHGAL